MVLAIDPERERISLGIKQLEDDPFNDYVAVNDRGTIVTGTVVEVTEKDAIIKLAEEVEGVLRASELSQERVEDARTVLKAGDEIEVKITAVDRKNRTLNLSVKAKDIEDERETMREHKERERDSATATTIGDLIRKERSEERLIRLRRRVRRARGLAEPQEAYASFPKQLIFVTMSENRGPPVRYWGEGHDQVGVDRAYRGAAKPAVQQGCGARRENHDRANGANSCSR